MKKIFKFAAIATAVITLFACEKPPQTNTEEPDKPNTEIPGDEKEIDYTEDIEFELELKSLEANAAEILITHNGTDDDTWYAFATTSTNVNVSLENMIEELTIAGGKITSLSNGTSKTVIVEDLKPETKYTYIVFAITADGDVYGTHAFIRFTTPISYGPNPAWTVEYTARQFIGNEEYEHTVTVTSTDRNPYFMTIVTKERFEQMIEEGQMLEYSAHAANYYGTPRAQAEEKMERGHVLLDIEPNGAFNVRKNCPDAVLIFIAPPSMEELERRLRSRGDTSEEQIRLRLDRVQWELEQSKQYDYVVINDGSRDNTREVCRRKKYNYINLSINLGIGGAVQTGYKYARDKDYDIAVVSKTCDLQQACK